MEDQITRLKRENAELLRQQSENLDKMLVMNFAIGILTDTFPPFSHHTRKQGQHYLDKRAAEWKQRQSGVEDGFPEDGKSDR